MEEKRDGEKEGKTERDGVEKNDDWDAGDAAAEADEVRRYIEYFRAGILLPSGPLSGYGVTVKFVWANFTLNR